MYDLDLTLIEKDFLKSIKIGHQNAIQFPYPLNSEQIQNIIDNYNLNGKLVLKCQKGYYHPNPADEEDDKSFLDYIMSKRKKAEDILTRCAAMESVYKLLSFMSYNDNDEEE